MIIRMVGQDPFASKAAVAGAVDAGKQSAHALRVFR